MIAHEELKRLASHKGKMKRIFFYRICGTGMGAAACLLKEMGKDVEGADILFSPPMSDYLHSTQIPCHLLENIKDEYLKTFDLIVVGNVVPKGGEDAKRIEALGVPYTSFPAALGALFLEEQNVVGVAGTHGKTTTTFLLVQLFEKLGTNPGYLIGGVLEDRPSARVGSGKYFFIESDEYDCAYFEKRSKFHFYAIKNLILTSLEFDHADIYGSLEEIEAQFSALIAKVKKSFVLNKDYPSIKKLQDQFKLAGPHCLEYGHNSGNGPVITRQGPEGTTFELIINSVKEIFTTNLTGPQNILNLSATILFAAHEGFAVEKIKSAVRQLQMVKRRQEIKGIYKGSLFIDDFAHHPRAVTLTLDSIHTQYPDKNILVIFEPASATARSSVFQEEFFHSLQSVSGLIIIKPARRSNIKNHQDLDCQVILSRLQEEENIPGQVVESLDELVKVLDDYLDNVRPKFEVVVTLSNGTLLGLWQNLFPHSDVPSSTHLGSAR